MAFLESPRFPEAIANGAFGGPGFSTTVVATASGKESRDGAWAYPRHAWDVSQGINDAADFDTLLAFFMVARGRQNGWRFKDWADYAATHAQGVVTAITGTTFQAFKKYTAGSATQLRKIVKPVAGTFEVKVSGVVTAHSVDTATGVITIASAPAAANVTWSGEFDVPMRFDVDRLERRLVARTPSRGLLQEWASIPIVELAL
jgi:uncharacterized protein (TIGR02217 family)